MNEDEERHRELVAWLDEIERGLWRVQMMLMAAVAVIVAAMAALVLGVM